MKKILFLVLSCLSLQAMDQFDIYGDSDSDPLFLHLDLDQYTPQKQFCRAAATGNTDILRCYIKDPEVSVLAEDERTHMTALDYAAINGHYQAVLYLLSCSKLKYFDCDQALRCSLEGGDFPWVVDLLCRSGANLWSDKRPLLVAAEEGRDNSLWAMIKHVIRHEKRDQILQEQNVDGENALLIAASNCHWRSVRVLDIMGVPQVPDKFGNTVHGYMHQVQYEKDMR